MLATRNDLATVGGLRRLLDSLRDMEPSAPVQWHVDLYDGPLTDETRGEVLVVGDAVEIVVSAPVTPTAVTPDASWIAA